VNEQRAGPYGDSIDVAYQRWQEWAAQQRDFIVSGRPDISQEEYETVALRFWAAGVELPAT
jgi:hypothetical protein